MDRKSAAGLALDVESDLLRLAIESKLQSGQLGGQEREVFCWSFFKSSSRVGASIAGTFGSVGRAMNPPSGLDSIL
jgi:hypothetical protein